MEQTITKRITTLLLALIMLITTIPINILADESSGKGGSSGSGGSGGAHNWIIDTNQGGYRLTLYYAKSKSELENGQAKRIGTPVIYAPNGGTIAYLNQADVKTTGLSVYDYMNSPKGIAENPQVEDLGGYFKEYKTVSKGRDTFQLKNLTSNEKIGTSAYLKGKIPTFQNAGNWSDELIDNIFGASNKYQGLIELSKDAGEPLTIEQIKKGSFDKSGQSSEKGGSDYITGKGGFGGKLPSNPSQPNLKDTTKSTSKGIYKVYIESVVGIKTNKVISRATTQTNQKYIDFPEGQYVILSLRDLIWFNMYLHDKYQDHKYNTIPGKAAIALQRTMNAIRLTKDQPDIQMFKNDSDLVTSTAGNDYTYKIIYLPY